MKINDITNMKDVENYVNAICSMPYRERLKIAEKTLQAPTDYADGIEQHIINNADLIEAYYLEYVEKSKHAPDQCVAMLQQEFGQKIIDLLGAK